MNLSNDVFNRDTTGGFGRSDAFHADENAMPVHVANYETKVNIAQTNGRKLSAEICRGKMLRLRKKKKKKRKRKTIEPNRRIFSIDRAVARASSLRNDDPLDSSSFD